jgi:hypothetical protein
MGAIDDWTTINGDKTQAEIEKQWPKINEQYCWDHGHTGYTGTLAEKPEISFPRGNKEFPNIHAAKEWINEHNDKWGPAFAVRVTKHLHPWNDITGLFKVGSHKIIAAHWLIGGSCSS